MALRCLFSAMLLTGLLAGSTATSLQAQERQVTPAIDRTGFTAEAAPAAQAPPAFWSGERTVLWRSLWAAAAVSAVSYGFLHDEVVIECGAPVTGDHCPSGFVLGESSTQPHRTAGLVVGGVALLAGWLHTRGGSDGAGYSESRVFPRTHGPGRVSLVRIPVLGASR